MAGRNRTDFELSQMIAALPSNMRGLLQEILYELANGSSQRAFTSTTLNALSSTELGYLDGVTAGTPAASKALVLNNNLDTGALRKVTGASFIVATASTTAEAGAATLNTTCGKVTTESLSTAAGSEYTLTLSNTSVAAADRIFVSVANGTNAAGIPVVSTVVPSAGQAVIKIANLHASQALSGTLVISFFVVPVT